MSAYRTVRLPAESADMIRALARKHDRPVSFELRRAVAMYAAQEAARDADGIEIRKAAE